MGGVDEAIAETRFQERLKRLSELPMWKREEIWKAMQDREMMFSDIKRIFGEDD